MFFFVAAVDFVSFASLYDCDFPLQFHRMDSTMRAILCSTMIEGNRVDEREGRSFFYFVFFLERRPSTKRKNLRRWRERARKKIRKKKKRTATCSSEEPIGRLSLLPRSMMDDVWRHFS